MAAALTIIEHIMLHYLQPCLCLLYLCNMAERWICAASPSVAKIRLKVIKENTRWVSPTFVGEPYPRVDAVGCVSRAQQNNIQQHQSQTHSPRALCHPH